MLRGLEDMLGRKIIAFLCAILVLSGCTSNSYEKDKNQIDNEKEVDRLDDFTTKQAGELLLNSIELIKSENFDFTPTKFNDQGLLIGELVDKSEASLKYVGYQNVKTGEFKIIKQLDNNSQDAHANMLYVTDDYICFSEISSDVKQSNNILLYDIKNDYCEKIYESEGSTQYTPMIVSINGNALYAGMSKDGNYNISVYDIQQKKWEVLVEERSNYPVVIKNKLYYIAYENNDINTKLYRMDLESKKQELLYTNAEDESIYSIACNEENLYVFIEEEYNNKCYLYDDKNNELTPYFQENPINNPIIENDFMVWWGNARTADRVKSQYYLLDIKNNIHYIYDDSLLLTSEKGVAWVKFNVDEREIPPLEIFKNNNSSIMFCKTDELIR